MKKLLGFIVIVGVVVGGFFILKNQELQIGLLEGKTEKTVRDDLVVPITASGRIQPKAISKIKGKAGGEVLEIPYEEGEMVKARALIVRLDKRDEERRVLQAETELKRAEHALAQAKLAHTQRVEAGLPLAEARVKQAQARFDQLEEDRQKKKEGLESGAVSPYEYAVVEASTREAAAALDAARAEQRQAKLAPDLAELDIEAAQQAVTNAEKLVEEAKQRLEETEVISPINGMVLQRHVEVGEVVQSATQAITGGTPLIDIADVSEIYAMVNVDEADIGMVRELAPPEARPGPKLHGGQSGEQVAGAFPATRPAEERASGQPAQDSADTPPAGDEPTTRPDDELVDLPEGTLGQGQEVAITIESFPDEEFRGVIERISPQSEVVQAIATFKVAIRIVSDNREKLIGLLNTHAEARFTAKSAVDKVLVNYDAVRKDPNSDRYGVYIPTTGPDGEQGDPKFVPCKFGVDNGIQVEVIEGLDEGDVVYTQLPVKTRRQREKEEAEKND